jgi:hypothetical protein
VSGHKVEAYLILEAEMGTYNPNSVLKVKAKEIRQGKPKLTARQIAVKIDLDIDDSWFKDTNLTAKVTVPPIPEDEVVTATVDYPIRPKAPSPAAAGIQKAST